MPHLVACSACHVHNLSSESTCRACGAPTRASDGRALPMTAGAVLLGLSLAATSAGCGDDTSGTGGNGGNGGGGGMTGTQTASAYGVGPGGGEPSTSSGLGGQGGAGGAGGQGGTGGAGGN